MQPALAAYLSSTGRAGATLRVEPSLRVGDFDFFDAAGTRVAAGPAGIVDGTRAATHAWWALLGAGDADVIAARIGWLEAPAAPGGLDARRLAPPTAILRGGAPPALLNVDPAVWRAVHAPRVTERGDERELVVWRSIAGGEPCRLVVRAPRAGAARFDERAGAELVDPGDVVARAIAALAGDDAAARRWALIELPRRRALAAAPAIAALLRHDDAATRAAAAAALATLRAPAAVAALRDAARVERDAMALRLLLSALGATGTPDAIAALAALRPPIADLGTRAELVHALARAAETSPAPARAALAAIAASDADPDLRALASTYAARLSA